MSTFLTQEELEDMTGKKQAAATARLGHASAATTIKHYRRAPEKVSPLRRILDNP